MSGLVLRSMPARSRSLRIIAAMFTNLWQHAPEVPADGAIAFARGFLELGPVEYGYASPRVADSAVVLKRSSDADHRRPVHPQHLGKIFLGQRQLVARNAVLRGQ